MERITENQKEYGPTSFSAYYRQKCSFHHFHRYKFQAQNHIIKTELQENLHIDYQILDNFHLFKYFGTSAQRKPSYDISMHQSAIVNKDTGSEQGI